MVAFACLLLNCYLVYDTPTWWKVKAKVWRGPQRTANESAQSIVEWAADFEYDFGRDKLAEHGVTFEEAAECFFGEFEIRRNKKFRDRYQLLGSTFEGRKLKLIFQVKPNSAVRIITGWPL